MQQDYGTESDWTDHFYYLLPFFKDRRYITHNGLPLFLIYRPADFPDVEQMMMLWNRLAREAGLPGICFVKTLTCFDARPACFPFQAAVCFEPWLTERRYSRLTERISKLARRALYRAAKWCGLNRTFVFSYDMIWKDILRRRNVRNVFPGAFVGWDNTPRMGSRSRVVAGSSPEKFGAYMRKLLANAIRDESPFVFINAWNEWAEGAYLEPDERHDYQYLEQLGGAIASCRAKFDCAKPSQLNHSEL
jgi:hypothetical protein